MAGRPETLPEGTDAIVPGAAVEGEAGDGFALGHNRDFNPIPLDEVDSVGSGKSGGGGTGASNESLKDTATRVVGEKTAGLRDQATDRARSFLVDGKDRATDALDNVVRMASDAADTIDDKLGGHYGDYVRRIADTVDGISSDLRDKDVEELISDARELVRRNPAIAIGAAAAVGFLLARVAKVGVAPGETTGSVSEPA